MEARIYIIDGITYTIVDHEVDSGLSISDIASVLNNMHSTDAYSSIVSDLVGTRDQSDREIEINIDRVNNGELLTTAVDRDPANNQKININSSEFEEGFNYPIPDVNYQPMQNLVDIALMHEVAHVHNMRVDNVDIRQDPSAGEIVAIARENPLLAFGKILSA